MKRIIQDGGRLWNFQKLISLLSYILYGLITGLADFFTEQCYWYLQSALNPYLKAAPLLVKKPDFPDFILFLLSFFLLSFFFKMSYPCDLSEAFELVSSHLGQGCATTGSKEGGIFCLWVSWLWQLLWLCSQVVGKVEGSRL